MIQSQIQPGHIARHTPQSAGSQGRGAAIIDVAQDLLLRHLSQLGLADRLVFKGGTSLRKFYAGSAGRFSTDLDFGIADIRDNPGEVISKLVDAVSGLKLAPFSYEMTERRGKWTVVYLHPFSGADYKLTSKIDINPPPWLIPVMRDWIPLPIHKRYGAPLPAFQVVRLEENIAEKIARLNRTTTARDMYDLSWIMTTTAVSSMLDRELIKRLTVLKIWVDANGVHGGNSFWKQSHERHSFDPEKWLRKRNVADFDTSDIGALAVPAPAFDELSNTISKEFSFLVDLSEDELTIAKSSGHDRPLVLKLLRELPNGKLKDIGLY
ncbi:MAG: nucleotidyl transferase AbiEii/AbiGii toxin family protein [Clostridiales bacterium]|nr:nucleotidyl transferase AbiEii/AbiGii toxin family protein [Clostridiales bacterium]